jgi:hypothetical protein
MESVACSRAALEPPCRDLTLPDMTKPTVQQAKRSEKLINKKGKLAF